jgi:hypothetical protein
MPLPNITTPTYELVLPSNDKKIKFRPFLVKEEKILIIALESKDADQVTNAVKDVISNCMLTKGIKVEELPIFDIEYLFLNIRSKAIGESIELIVTCGDDGVTKVPVTIYVDEIKVEKPKDHTNKIEIDGGYTVQLKYPSLDQFIGSNFEISKKSSESLDKSLKLVSKCIDMVYNEDDCWAASDCTEKELVEWIEKLSPKDYKKIEKFFKTMPKLSHKITVINPETKVENPIVLEGLSDFFA